VVLLGMHLVLLSPLSARAQNTTGRILGTVTNSRGSVVEGARVTVTNAGSNVWLETVSRANGSFEVIDLPVGDYVLTVEAEGFKKVVASALHLAVNQSLRIDVRLEVGARAETISVIANAAIVETVDPTIGARVAGTPIDSLPLNGRDTLQLAQTQPGISPAPATPFAASGILTGSISVAGGRDSSITYLLDGGSDTSVTYGVPIIDPNPDTVAEFRVLTNNYTAEYGRTAGGVVSIVTKSGTNELHGSVFNYLRNDDLDANNFFSKIDGQPRPVLKRNQFGGTLGGPITMFLPETVKGGNRWFFFFGYQGQRQTEDIVNPEVETFTPAELSGNFSGNHGVEEFLQSHPYFQSKPVLAAQGVIDPTKVDPVAKSYAQAGLIPTAPTGVLTPEGRATDNRDQYLAKVDFNATLRDRFSATLVASHNPTQYPFLSPGLAPDVPGFPGLDQSDSYFGNITYSRTISAEALNDFRVTTQLNETRLNSPGKQLPGPAQLGFVDSTGDPSLRPDLQVGPPQIIFLNSGAQLGFNLLSPFHYTDTTGGYSDVLMWIKGRHMFKAGGSLNFVGTNIHEAFAVDGQFDYAGTGSGSDLADFLFGLPTAFLQGGNGISNIRSRQYTGFYQDEWRVLPRLVLTLGIRYEYSTPKTELKGRSETIVPGLQSQTYPDAPLGLVFPGDPGVPRGVTFPDRNGWAPRLGFAWDPSGSGKTSLRGGVGVFYDLLLAVDNEGSNGSPPFSVISVIDCLAPCSSGASSSGPYTFQSDPYGSSGTPNPFPSSSLPSPQQLNFAKEGFLPFGALSGFIDLRERTPYVYQYNLSLQRQLGTDLAAEVGYVGSSSRKLLAWVDRDPILLGTNTYLLNTQPGLQHFTDQSGNPIPAFDEMPLTSINGTNASYNGLLASIRKQVCNWDHLGRMFFTLSYTWSHEIDAADGLFRTDQQVPYYNHDQFRASGATDIRNRLVFSGGWTMPLDHVWSTGPHWLTAGWSLYPIITAQSGMPIDVNAGLPVLGNGIPGPSGAGDQNLVRPDVVGPLSQLDPSQARTLIINGTAVTGHFMFDPNSLTDPPCFSSVAIPGSGAQGACPSPTYGTLSRDFFRGPSRFNFDVALEKRTNLNERLELAFRGEYFNVLNHTEFQNPVGPVVFLSPQVGQVTSTFDPRIGQLSLRLSF
jgi:hypothetical protein